MGLHFCRSRNINRKANNVRTNLSVAPNNNVSEVQKENNIECLKIYLCGSGKGIDYLLNNIFKECITDQFLKEKADWEFKTKQFHWILTDHSSNKLTDDICKIITQEIKVERNSDLKENKIINQQVIICFGEQNLKILCKYFKEIREPRIIAVTESQCEINIDKRYVTNIITEGMNEEEVSSFIISSLWELDCYYNGKGNLICRYTPENIFSGLEKDNSLFSLNILLLGKSRTGKSTLINLIAGKMIALESDNNTSITKKILEYHIYRNDDKNGHSAIKFIDTPGIIPYKKDQEYLSEKNKIEYMIRNNKNQKNLEKKIHFILFLLMKDDLSIEGVEEFLKLVLKESNCPVFFIINKGDNDDDIEEIKDNLNETLGEDLLEEDQFINANLKKGCIQNIYGISEIFKKISNYIKDKKILDENLKSKMDNLLQKFRMVEENCSIISLKEEDKSKITNLKEKIQFNQKMEEIKKICNSNDYFSSIDINSIIENGKNNAQNCKEVIISLSNLQGILPRISQTLPLLSIFQGYMIKLIKDGFGLNNDSLKYGIKLLNNDFDSILEENKNKNINEIKKDKKILDEGDLNDIFNEIEKKLKDYLNCSNKKLIFKLADFLNNLGELTKENQIKMNSNFNEEFTDMIEYYCVLFFEKEIIESEGLSFMVNYYDKLKLLLEDIDYYSQKDDWGTYEMIIKKKNLE